VHASFAIVSFQEHLGPQASPNFIAQGTTFVGDQSSVKDFQVAGRPQGPGYLIVQTAGVGVLGIGIQILINGQPIRSDPNEVELPAEADTKNFQTTLQVFGALLQHGTNTLQFKRLPNGSEFVVNNVVVNWMEEDVGQPQFNPVVLQGLR
jgi:hypothetical protein